LDEAFVAPVFPLIHALSGQFETFDEASAPMAIDAAWQCILIG
jgi:hypothetical protein